MTDTSSGGALEGIKVVEMGQLIAGPFCGQLLGDMGAEIVKLEPPGTGDQMRNWGQGDRPSWWRVIARNKYSVAVDLRSAEGQALARDLIAKADILIENFRPGTLEKWNLDPIELRKANPGLIIVRVSGYGQTGPYSARAGFGGIGEAMGGWRGIVGYPDLPPARMGVSIGDTLAASYGCLGALAALHHRNRTGEGQIVDSALYEAVLQVMESTVSDYSASGTKRRRTGSTLPGIAPSNVYPCKDGEYLIGANQDGVFARLATAMGRPELADDERYATHRARGLRQEELDALIGEWTATMTIAELEARMVEASVPAGRVFDAEDMLADPHFAAREALVTIPDEELGEVTMQGVFPKLSATPGSVRRPAPLRVGQDTADVLGRWLGRED
ncbi:CaiB/BaiF CoA transferase family protein [Sphingopyxis sp. RIFCSPHIGHO2_12_FULL_65_19]|uniref:CaiB/BaiF CoA transferase family protein n=1 Tax=Sphingopyxis sp. RIFCSPHIGHO2_12_FULL_65_19 TaxID=1802172 RepID=UPI0008AB3AED|nr:CoA transferase [Sphingopyxis sp. RIFCSPHIGHO2_12_FULL_65_19]OHD07300.1 MAG: formyl-CoA transferase [Sphingopyxis sp. RIFCSPHIGHO2_12_FULL_65_19]